MEQKPSARILVVDDDALFREAVRIGLQAAGFDVIEASDGMEALRTLRAQPSDLIVCDLFMPGKDGLETIPELRREFPQTKILAVSAGGAARDVNVLRVADHLGAAEVLRKPFDQSALLAAVQRLLASAPSEDDDL